MFIETICPLDDFHRWNVAPLKYYLRQRGFKTAGKKAELVSLCFAANILALRAKLSAQEVIERKADF